MEGGVDGGKLQRLASLEDRMSFEPLQRRWRAAEGQAFL